MALELPWPEIEEDAGRQVLEELIPRLQTLWEFQQRRILVRIQEVLARYPTIGADSLVALALPVTLEQRLDGSFLGLSPNLSVDAFHIAETMVLDLKFGRKQGFHRLTTTGYALVMESLYEYPINLGCIVYVNFKGTDISLERDFHLIDDELRQQFIEERDERMRMVAEEIDPGLPDNCQTGCPYWRECHPE
jgi:CRISPR-associated protein Csa1